MRRGIFFFIIGLMALLPVQAVAQSGYQTGPASRIYNSYGSSYSGYSNGISPYGTNSSSNYSYTPSSATSTLYMSANQLAALQAQRDAEQRQRDANTTRYLAEQQAATDALQAQRDAYLQQFSNGQTGSSYSPFMTLNPYDPAFMALRGQDAYQQQNTKKRKMVYLGSNREKLHKPRKVFNSVEW